MGSFPGLCHYCSRGKGAARIEYGSGRTERDYIMKCIVGKDLNIEGHCIQGYYTQTARGVFLVIAGKSCAKVFPSNECAYAFREKQTTIQNVYVEPYEGTTTMRAVI
jgi:hypothetical protein